MSDIKSSTMYNITARWRLDDNFINDITFLIANNKDIQSYLIDYYFECLIHMRDNRTICLTPQGKLDTYNVEYKLRQNEKQRMQHHNDNTRCHQSYFNI